MRHVTLDSLLQLNNLTYIGISDVLDDLALAGMLLTVEGLVEQTYGPNPVLLCPSHTSARLHRWAQLTSVIEARACGGVMRSSPGADAAVAAA